MHPLVAGILAGSVGGLASFLSNPGGQNYVHINPSALATSGIRIATDRDVDEQQGSGTYIDRSDWLQSGGVASQYEVRATLNSGSLDAGSDTTGSYLALSSSREWYCESNGGSQSASLTIDIRRSSSPSDAISFTCTLNADGTPL